MYRSTGSRCQNMKITFERRNENDWVFLKSDVAILKWVLLFFHIFLVLVFATTIRVKRDGIGNLAIVCHCLVFLSNVIPLIAGVTMKRRSEIIRFSECCSLALFCVFGLILLTCIQTASGMKNIPNDYSKFVQMGFGTILKNFFTRNLTCIEALSVIFTIIIIIDFIACLFILRYFDQQTSTIHNTDEEMGLDSFGGQSASKEFSPLRSKRETRQDPVYGSFKTLVMQASTDKKRLFHKNLKTKANFQGGRISEHPSLESLELKESSDCVRNNQFSLNLDTESHKRISFDYKGTGESEDFDEYSQEDIDIDIDIDVDIDVEEEVVNYNPNGNSSKGIPPKTLEELKIDGKTLSLEEIENMQTKSREAEEFIYDPQRYDRQEVLEGLNGRKKKNSKLSKGEKLL